jgi:hypothetical protein
MQILIQRTIKKNNNKPAGTQISRSLQHDEVTKPKNPWV